VTEVIERLQAKGMSEAVPFVSTVASMTGKVIISFFIVCSSVAWLDLLD
jgi:Na+-translocating ferredoxin:NAD+ oxidoreductase RnfA subunit